MELTTVHDEQRKVNDAGSGDFLNTIKVFAPHISWKSRIYYVITTAKAMLTGHWFSLSVIDLLEHNAEDVYDRLLGEWATMGVVSALVLSLAYSAYQGSFTDTYPTFNNIDGDFVIALLSFLCISLFMVSLCSSILLSMGLMTLPVQYSTKYVREIQYLVAFPEMFMVSGLYVFVAQILVAGIYYFGESFQGIAITIGVIGLVITLLTWISIVLILDRKNGLWELARREKLESTKGKNEGTQVASPFEVTSSDHN